MPASIHSKPDGWQRPLGIAAFEDKIVQRAAVEILNALYETDFSGFSYWFRPGRIQHDALDALTVGIHRMKLTRILDADTCPALLTGPRECTSDNGQPKSKGEG